MVIYCDVDGCLLDILTAIKRRDERFIPTNVCDYNFETEVYGIPREDVLRYLSQKKTFTLQKPYRGAKEGIKQLQTLGKVIGWSRVPDNVRELRMYQLKKLGIRSAHLYGMKEGKIILDNVDCVIEDCAEELAKHKDKQNLIRILIDHKYNRAKYIGKSQLEGVYRVKNILEAYELLRKLQDTS